MMAEAIFTSFVAVYSLLKGQSEGEMRGLDLPWSNCISIIRIIRLMSGTCRRNMFLGPDALSEN
jgi:hypothetical protein